LLKVQTAATLFLAKGRLLVWLCGKGAAFIQKEGGPVSLKNIVFLSWADNLFSEDN